MLLEFIKNVALLLSLCLLQGFSLRLCRENKRLQQLLTGCLFGCICVVGMMTPVQLEPGVIFDARSAILSMAGLFGGALVATIAGVIAGVYRLWLGGATYGVGILTIVISVVLGLAYRAAHQRGWMSKGPIQLLLFGVLLHTAILLLFSLFPFPILHSFMQQIALPYTVSFALATMLLGLMLQDIINRTKTEQALQDSESRLRAIV